TRWPRDWSSDVCSSDLAGSKLPATVSPTSVNVPANGTTTSTLTVTATSNIGNYNIVVIGIASSHGKTTYASADLSVQVVSNQDRSEERRVGKECRYRWA